MGIAYNPKIVTDGLMLCLDAGNTKSYPGSGTTWTDLSGRGNNGTQYNTPTFNSSGIFTYDGTNQYTEGTFTALSTAITISSWAKILSYPSQYSQIIGSYNNAGAIYVGPNTSTIFGQLSFTTNGNQGSGSTNLTLNSWYQVDITWQSGSPIILYINGTFLSQSSNFTDTINFPGYRIARYASGTYLNCVVSNSKIYNRALTASEIQQNFNATRGRYGI